MCDISSQYKTPKNLNIRAGLHAKYSVNQTPFADWIASFYAFAPGAHILELGCGTGQMWITHLDLLSDGAELTLTDLSAGMVQTARENLRHAPRIAFDLVDIQNIPYPDGSFDAVIANMMLYHVPDLHRGLSEVWRVLKPGGKFYCATNGEHGVHQYTTELLRELGVHNRVIDSFTLQNGGASLSRHFSRVTRRDRQDSLIIPNLDDYADYVYSLDSLSRVDTIPRRDLMDAIERRAKDGVLHIPKEFGMFICEKDA